MKKNKRNLNKQKKNSKFPYIVLQLKNRSLTLTPIPLLRFSLCHLDLTPLVPSSLNRPPWPRLVTTTANSDA